MTISPRTAAAVQQRARCLFSEQEAEAALDSMARQISDRLVRSNPLILCVMNGGMVVTGKLATRLNFPAQFDYLHATRYRNETSGAALRWRQYPSHELRNRTVLVVDDILDEGITLQAIMAYCRQQGAENVLSAVLVEKQLPRRPVGIEADFVGLQAENAYLFGYGMDYKGYLRNAAGIFAVDPVDVD